MEIVQQEGARQVKRVQAFYNLDVIISVGYRVNSRRATHFRKWADGRWAAQSPFDGFVLLI